jgi:dTDP-4-amino-4,6-dideoxygalactose transaminase
MTDPAVPHNRLTHGPEESGAVAAVVASGQWAAGERVTELERRLAARAGIAHAVCVGSGLAALRLSLHALGVGPGARVAVPAYSCVALANAALSLGADPIPVEVERGTWNIDPAAVGRADAVVAVHTFGARARLAELGGGAPLVEDCAHAFGLPGLGSGADMAILSFYATKLLGAGEGGAVLTGSAELAENVRAHRDYTDLPADGTRGNDKPTDLMAALALAQLDRLDAMLEARTRLAGRYRELLQPAGDILGLPLESPDRVWYRYAIELRGLAAGEAIARLARAGVHAAEPVHDWRPPGSSVPVADAAYRSLLSLPLYPTLADEEQERVADAVLGLVQA